MQRTWRSGSPDSQFERWLMIVSMAMADLTGLPVADDQLPLAPADGGHRVDGLDTGLQRLLDRLPLHHRGRLGLQGPQLGVGDLALAVQRDAQRVDHAAEEAVPDRDREDLAGPADLLAFLDLAEVTQDDDTDLADLQVQGEAAGAVLEFEQLVGHGRGQALDPCNTVATFDDGADLLQGGRLRLIRFDEARQSVPDLVRPDCQLRHLPQVSRVSCQLVSLRRRDPRRVATLPSISSSPT